jgi:hypothetical protein
MNPQLAMFQQVIGLAGIQEREVIERNVVIVAREPQETSLKAALRALPKTGTKRAHLYDYLASCSGATDEEIERALGISGNTVRPTRVSLVRDGLVEDSGLVRPTLSGNDAIVWRVRDAI